MSLFAVPSDDEAIGWSVWPWDDFYEPVVGCFVDGALLTTSVCNLQRNLLTRPLPTLPLRSRLKRRVLRVLGLEPGPLPAINLGALTGPDQPVWFRMSLPGDITARIRADDPSVRIERLEDSDSLIRSGMSPEGDGAAVKRVEYLLNATETRNLAPMDGFPSFLTSPAQFQLEMMFVEYLRRMPEKSARDAFLPQLLAGELTALDLRSTILKSDEFKSRRIGFGSRLGGLVTSSAWKALQRTRTLLDQHRALDCVDCSRNSDLATTEFITFIIREAFGRDPTKAEVGRLAMIADGSGRTAAGREVARLAARTGRYLTIE